MKERGFRVAKGWEDRGIELPRRSTAHAAGYDIAAAEDITVPIFHPGIKPTLIPTGLKAYCQSDECYLIFNRSSGANKGIVTANGVGLVDADYYENPTNDGHIYIIIYNTSDHELHIKKGDRIAQIVFQKFLTVDDDVTNGCRQGGFGSTDKPCRTDSTKPIRVVYDLDDVLWDFTRYVMKKLRLDHKTQTDFHINDDPVFTESEKATIIDAFSNAENFCNLKFYPEAQKIFQISSPRVEVMINSNAYSDEIIKTKQACLRDFYPDVPESCFQINLVTPSSNRKRIDSDVFVFVDDSPYNIAGSAAKFNLVPRKTWNTTVAAQQVAIGQDKTLAKDWQGRLAEFIASDYGYVIPVKDLCEANDFVRQAINLKQGGTNE